MEDILRLKKALEGANGAQQQRIAEVGLNLLCTLLRKNRDYGGSAFAVPVLAPSLPARTAILVRMSDKIARLNTLMQKGTSEVNESIRDTILDLGGYSILWSAAPDEVPDEGDPWDGSDLREGCGERNEGDPHAIPWG